MVLFLSMFVPAANGLCTVMHRVFAVWRRYFTAALLLACVAALQSCYLPEQFTADLQLSRNGDYHFSYKGQLRHAALAKDLMDGKVTPADEKQRAATILNDLERDVAFGPSTYAGRGVFNVSYDRTGNIMQEKSFNFVRRNSRILQMMYHERSQTVEVRGSSVPAQYLDTLTAMGYVPNGTITVHTNVHVRRENASSRKTVEDETTLNWTIQKLGEPALILILG
ncbi:hypothetical protein [Thalassospira mesophila]|uniref:hypothetical protein n=1 Tax=Thalassospira mesophila TaxID=1293891 RepID=UPI000A1F854F|nr:hypothetical protein [Thalassospira mesophila]